MPGRCLPGLLLGDMGMHKGFFAALSGGLHPGSAREVQGGVPIPDGWEIEYWLGRPVWNGMCTMVQIEDGTVDLKMLMDMHKSLNLRDYIEKEAYEIARRNGGH